MSKENNRLKEQLKDMMDKHQQMRETIENDAWDKIDLIKEKNKEELAKIIEDGLKHKADLTLITNSYKVAKTTKDTSQRGINDKQTLLDEQITRTNNFRQ